MSDYQPITKADGWHCDEDQTFVYVARDGDGLPQDLTGMAMAWNAYLPGSPGGATAVVGPKTTDDGITIVTVSLSSIESRLARMGIDMTGWPSTLTVAKVAIDGGDTAGRAPGTLEVELWCTDAPVTLLAHGPAELLPSIRR